MEDRRYIFWKPLIPIAQTFRTIAQIRILVTFLEQPAAKDESIIHLVDKLVSDTCGCNPSWNKDLRLCL